MRHAGPAAGELDEGQPVDGAGELAGAAFVDPQHRGQMGDGGVVDVEGVGQQLADRRTAARAVRGVLVAGREQQRVGGGAARLVGPEEGADVEPKRLGEVAEAGALRERGEGEIHEQVGAPVDPERVPAFGAGGPAEQGEDSGDAAERMVELRGGRELSGGGQAPALGEERDEGDEQDLVNRQRAPDIPQCPGARRRRETRLMANDCSSASSRNT